MAQVSHLRKEWGKKVKDVQSTKKCSAVVPYTGAARAWARGSSDIYSTNVVQG